FHRMVGAAAVFLIENGNVLALTALVLALRNLVDTHVEGLRDRDLMLRLIGITLGFIQGRAHPKLARRDESKLHADGVRDHLVPILGPRRICSDGREKATHGKTPATNQEPTGHPSA